MIFSKSETILIILSSLFREKRDNKLDENYNNRIQSFSNEPSINMHHRVWISTIFLRLISPLLHRKAYIPVFLSSDSLPCLFVSRLMNAKLPCKTKALPPPSPPGIRHLFIHRSLFAGKEKERENESKRENKVKVNPLVSIVPTLQLVIITEK